MIEVKNLTKKYGKKYALKNVNFKVEDGEILGFLGPNGAGKSTTMNILTGYLSATKGEAIISGHNILEEPIPAKKHIGYLPEHPPLYLDMSVQEYLDFAYDLKKVSIKREDHIGEICKLVKIENVYKRVIKHLSKGYRQRVGLAQALLGNPDVLIMDEPTVGLDPKQIIEIRTLIKRLGKRHTVILSSHILSEVQAVCDRVLVINEGEIIADDTPDNLQKAMSTEHKLIVRISGPEKEVLKLMSTLPNIVMYQSNGEREKGIYEYELEAKSGTDLRSELFKRLAEKNWPLVGMRGSEMSLEDVFLQLISEEEEK